MHPPGLRRASFTLDLDPGGSVRDARYFTEAEFDELDEFIDEREQPGCGRPLKALRTGC